MKTDQPYALKTVKLSSPIPHVIPVSCGNSMKIGKLSKTKEGYGTSGIFAKKIKPALTLILPPFHEVLDYSQVFSFLKNQLIIDPWLGITDEAVGLNQGNYII